MATYYSMCRRFGSNFSACPIRQHGEPCVGCDNQVWILRKKHEGIAKTSENEASEKQESEADVK